MEARIVFRNTLIVLGTLAAAYLLLSSVRILIILLIAIIIASAVRPIVVRLVKWRVPSGAAILLVYGFIAFMLLVLVLIVLPPVVTQIANYINTEGRLASRIVFAQNFIQNQITNLTGTEVQLATSDQIETAVADVVEQIRVSAPNLIGGVGSTLGEAFLVFIMGVYWLTSHESAISFISDLFTVKNRERVRTVVFEIEASLGSYMRGIASVAIIVALANFLALSAFRIPNAAALAFIVGVGTILPVIGGVLSGVLATLLALLISPVQGLVVFIVFILVQQIESNFLTPRAMSRAMRIDPLLVLVAVFTGFAVYGVLGAIIAVPVIGTIAILLRTFIFEPRRESVKHKVEGGGVILNLGSDVPSPIPSAGEGTTVSESGIITAGR